MCRLISIPDGLVFPDYLVKQSTYLVILCYDAHYNVVSAEMRFQS